MARLVSKVSFAEKAGVSRSAITQASKEGGALYFSVIDDQIDIDTESAKKYLFKKRIPLEVLFTLGYSEEISEEYEAFLGSAAPVKPKASGLDSQTANSFIQDPSQKTNHIGFHDRASLISHYGNKTLNEIIREFGTDESFSKFANSLKVIAEIEGKKLDLAKKRGEVVDKQLVKDRVLSHLETLNMRLLFDLPGHITRKVSEAVKTDSNLKEVELEVQGMISKALKDGGSRADRGLNKC